MFSFVKYTLLKQKPHYIGWTEQRASASWIEIARCDIDSQQAQWCTKVTVSHPTLGITPNVFSDLSADFPWRAALAPRIHP
jgi:hypothetical protein